MDVKRLASAAAIVTGISALTSGAAFINAAPVDPPPPCPTCQPGPGEPGNGPQEEPAPPPAGYPPPEEPPRVGGSPEGGQPSVEQA
jgi:hypothetical protein